MDHSLSERNGTKTELALYFREVSRFPLLTGKQQKLLALRRRQGEEAREELFKEVRVCLQGKIHDRRVQEMLQRVGSRHGGVRLQTTLVDHHLSLGDEARSAESPEEKLLHTVLDLARQKKLLQRKLLTHHVQENIEGLSELLKDSQLVETESIQAAKELADLTHQAALARLERIVQVGEEACERMWCANLRLVVSIARCYQERGLPLADLIEEGNLGLRRAIESYDPEKWGTKFSTYASYWIRQTIQRAVQNQAKTIQIPAYLHEYSYKAQEVLDRMQQEKGREVSFEQAVEVLPLKERLRERLIEGNKAANVQMFSEYFEGQDFSHDQGIPDPHAASPNAHLLLSADLQRMRQALAVLDERESFILRHRFELGGEEKMTLQEIAKMLGLTRERIRQIESKALRKLRNVLEPPSSASPPSPESSEVVKKVQGENTMRMEENSPRGETVGSSLGRAVAILQRLRDSLQHNLALAKDRISEKQIHERLRRVEEKLTQLSA